MKFFESFVDEIEKIAVGWKAPLAAGAAGLGIGTLLAADPIGRDIARQRKMTQEEARKTLAEKRSYLRQMFPGTRGYQEGRRERAKEIQLAQIKRGKK